MVSVIFFFNDTATTEIYTLSLHDALPICTQAGTELVYDFGGFDPMYYRMRYDTPAATELAELVLKVKIGRAQRLNSSHANISYAVFCLKKKKTSGGGKHLSTLSRTELTLH